MILSNEQKDSITELINISFSKAAASLSELTGHRVLLSVPEIDILKIDDIEISLSKYIFGEISTVHQIFNGPISGDALLLLDKQSAKLLVNLLVDDTNYSEDFDISTQEVIVEVGNILLNACLGVFGNLLKVQFKFSVPILHVQSLENMLKSIVLEKEELRYAMIVFMEFKLRDSNIKGFLIIVLGVTSLDKFLKQVQSIG
ncbi:MAG: chemotaxis protein CheC [Stygiobacter sp.]